MDFGIFTIVPSGVLVHPIGQKDKSPFFFLFLFGGCVCHRAKKMGFALLLVKLWDPSHVKGKKFGQTFNVKVTHKIKNFTQFYCLNNTVIN